MSPSSIGVAARLPVGVREEGTVERMEAERGWEWRCEWERDEFRVGGRVLSPCDDEKRWRLDAVWQETKLLNMNTHNN